MPIPINRSKIRKYSKIELLASQVVEGFITGLHKSPFHGFSVEFAEHRQYNNGESSRHIDWKLFARTDKLFVKRYEEETNLRCQIVLDVSPSMYFPQLIAKDFENLNKIGFSVYATAAISLMLQKQRDAVGLTLFHQEIKENIIAKNNGAHLQLIMQKLQDVLNENKFEEEQKTKAAKVIHQMAATLHKRSLVIIFSDMLAHESEEEVFDALRRLKHNKHEVILFHIMDKKFELNLEYENRPYRFVDMETNEVLKLNPQEIRSHYQKSMAQKVQNLKLKCSQYRIDFVDVDINEGFDAVLLPYFLKRRKMF